MYNVATHISNLLKARRSTMLLLLPLFFQVAAFLGSACASARLQLGLIHRDKLSRSEADNATNIDWIELARRQVTPFQNTCGYNTGDSNQPRTADALYVCRVDVENSLWGFCPSSVIKASDCGLAGNCVDSHACIKGWGISGETAITTFTPPNSAKKGDFCSTALLTVGPDQTYSYIACGAAEKTDHSLAAPTPEDSSTAIPSTSSPTPRSTFFIPSSSIQIASSSTAGTTSSVVTTSRPQATSSLTTSSLTSTFPNSASSILQASQSSTPVGPCSASPSS